MRKATGFSRGSVNTIKIYELIADTDRNIKNLQSSIEKALGLSAWSMAFGIGLVHYNYRSINEDIFGKAYETFLAED